MNDLLSWMPLETARDVGWTLIHFLWQGLLLAAVLNAVLPLCRSAVARHNCALAVLALMALAPVATFLCLHGFENNGRMPLADNAGALASALAPWMNALVLLWLAGVAALSLRAVGGWTLARSLGRVDTLAIPAGLLQRCEELQRRMRMASPVRFVLSRRIAVPMVIGWLRPVVLIPVSALAGLSPQQLDALILHELAHIRRLDTAANLLLVAVETVLFYHPAVWWVGRRIRVEREHCCDDFAVSACGDVGLYVEALTSLQASKATGGLALAANGGRLKDRVARLLDAPVRPSRDALSGLAGLALAGLMTASVALAAPSSLSKTMTDIRPIQETHTLPPYPRESIHLKEEGRVLLAVTIGTDGAVSSASVFKPSGHQRLDAAATEYVKSHWRWQPATRAGKPVRTKTRVSVLFKLKPKSDHATP